MKKISLSVFFVGMCLFPVSTIAQKNSTEIPSNFQSLFGNLNLKVDTTSPPEDSLTKKIRIFRSERGLMSFDTAIKYQIENQQSNDTKRPKEFYPGLLGELQHGHASHLIENILINLYRQCFTEKEVDQLVEFYKTPAGKKMMVNVMIITATAGPAIQQIVKETADKMDNKMKAEGKKK